MKYFVNDNCIGCGLCTEICPSVFKMTDEGVARAENFEVSPDDSDSAEEAMESCPTEAIEEA